MTAYADNKCEWRHGCCCCCFHHVCVCVCVHAVCCHSVPQNVRCWGSPMNSLRQTVQTLRPSRLQRMQQHLHSHTYTRQRLSPTRPLTWLYFKDGLRISRAINWRLRSGGAAEFKQSRQRRATESQLFENSWLKRQRPKRQRLDRKPTTRATEWKTFIPGGVEWNRDKLPQGGNFAFSCTQIST